MGTSRIVRVPPDDAWKRWMPSPHSMGHGHPLSRSDTTEEEDLAARMSRTKKKRIEKPADEWFLIVPFVWLHTPFQ